MFDGPTDDDFIRWGKHNAHADDYDPTDDQEPGIADQMHQLADYITTTQAPAPDVIYLWHASDAAEWAKNLRYDTDLPGIVGLHCAATVTGYTALGGVTGTEVRTAWLPDPDTTDRERMATALHTLADLVTAGTVPEPARVIAQHQITATGEDARREARRIADTIGGRLIEVRGDVIADRHITLDATYSAFRETR